MGKGGGGGDFSVTFQFLAQFNIKYIYTDLNFIILKHLVKLQAIFASSAIPGCLSCGRLW